MTYNDDFNNFLMAGGTPSAKFDTTGTAYRGRIVSAEVQDQKDLEGNVRTWDDGRPRKQLKVVVATDLRDPEVQDDNGERAIYVKGQMQNAVRDAIRAAGQSRMEIGGELAVKYERDEPSTKRGYNPTKIYRAKYTAPAAVDDFFDTPGHASTAAPAVNEADI